MQPMCPHRAKGRTEKGALSTQYRGVDSTRRGKAPPLAVFGDFLPAESHPSGASHPAGKPESGRSEEHLFRLPNDRQTP